MKKKEDWGAGKCIKGESTLKEVQPDVNLGKATKYNESFNLDLDGVTYPTMEMIREYSVYQPSEQKKRNLNQWQIIRIMGMRNQQWRYYSLRNSVS